MTDKSRHDLVSSREANLCPSWICRSFDILRQHNRFPGHLLIREHLQRSRWIGAGKACSVSVGIRSRTLIAAPQIEVVPFFHHMALKIMDIIGAENPEAVIATTIVAYAASSMMTGIIFYLMGRFKFGFMVGFIPRHILIGCIGGVGWFLIATGLEVSARLGGSLEYNVDTLVKLTQPDTVLLWVFPLVLATALFYGQSRVRSKYFLPLYILAIPLVFYTFVTSMDALNADSLRDDGWIFNGPPPGEPWWYFYTLYSESPTIVRRSGLTSRQGSTWYTGGLSSR